MTRIDVDTFEHGDQTYYVRRETMLQLVAAINADAASSANNGYYAILSQAGTAAPVAVVMPDSNFGTVVWTRSSAGTFLGTLAGAFVATTTWYSAQIVVQQVGGESKVDIIRVSDDVVRVTVRDFADNLVDGFAAVYIEIKRW